MKNIKDKIAYFLLGSVFGLGLIASTSASGATLQGFQGGTGISSATSSNIGQFLQVASTSPFLTYTFGSASGTSVSVATTTIQGIQSPIFYVVTSTAFSTFDFRGSSTSTLSLIMPTYTSSSLSSTLLLRDAYGNATFNNYYGLLAAPAGSGTTTLSIASARVQVFTSGGGNFQMVLPDARTLVVGWMYEVNNNSPGTLTVEDNTNAPLFTIPTGGYGIITLTSNSFQAGQWDKHFLLPANASFGTNGLIITGTLNTSGNINSSGTISQSGVPVLTTSTWVINASGSNTFANNWGGSSTIWTSGYITTSTWVVNASSNIAVFNSGGSSTVAVVANPSFNNVSTTGNETVTGNSQILGTLSDAGGNKYSTSTPTYPIQWTIGNETSNVFDGIFTFNNTSTMKSVYAGSFGLNASGSVTFNLGFTTSTSNPTSTWEKLFTSDQTVTSIGSSTKLSINGSTTWSGASGQPWILGYYTGGNSSSSEFTITSYFTTP